ncbi:hypothetical protein SAMN06297251_11482 [Fulvimarina manganoxydans]|uniref:PIN domain-containing protein n=1 Tax=Fulvimarina manganoxydans TaxID=937218 RepID=A0A1W2DFD9_9HYPH|nr:type II toxin-antitoxin system VapC family toxin [Fulvimarina manganoxydans]SMC95852.1 hypothetical protein SAMN06297251_11482 [Fulvimarina manganoxydans]
MILLDTNVISELVRPACSQQVFDWVASQPRSSLVTGTIVQAEIQAGLAIMPAGSRRRILSAALADVFGQFQAILPFTADAANHYAEIVMMRRMVGRPLEGFDGLIAATARSLDATIATRNVADFTGCGVELVDPWNA